MTGFHGALLAAAIVAAAGIVAALVLVRRDQLEPKAEPVELPEPAEPALDLAA